MHFGQIKQFLTRGEKNGSHTLIAERRDHDYAGLLLILAFFKIEGAHCTSGFSYGYHEFGKHKIIGLMTNVVQVVLHVVRAWVVLRLPRSFGFWSLRIFQ